MKANREQASSRSVWPAWFAVGAAIAAWEIFLRVDSLVLGTATKIWFLTLLGGTVLTTVLATGSVIHSLARRVLPADWARRSELVMLTGVAATLFAAEYLAMTHYHVPTLRAYWPAAAGAGAVIAALARWGTPRTPLRLSPGSSLIRRSILVALVPLTLLGVTATCVAMREDLGTNVLHKNTLLGRGMGWPLSRLARLPEEPAGTTGRLPDRPASESLGPQNVILLCIDTLRADFLSSYSPDARSTPAMDALAAEAVLFEDAFSQRSTSAPSMASILTGSYLSRHGVRENGMVLPDEAKTLAEFYRDEGFATAAFVTNWNFDAPFNFHQGFDVYEFFEAQEDEFGLITNSSDAPAVNAALAWLRENRERPIFLWVHLMTTHSPYLPEGGFTPALQPGKGEWMNVLNVPFAIARVESMKTYFDRDVYLDLYAAEVATVDHHVGRFLDGVRDLDLIDDAHVLLLSDHGESFGEGDAFGHGHSINPFEARIPLLWKLPKSRRAGTRLAMTTQGADIAPSLLRLAGFTAERPGALRMDGRDISGILLGETPPDDGFAFSEAGYTGTSSARAMQYAARTRQRAIHLDVGFPYLSGFDRAADPGETRPRRVRPRTDDPLYVTLKGLVAESELQLRQADPRQVRDELPEGFEEKLKALGYIR